MKFELTDFLKLINYQITEGSRYLWECYGKNAYYWDYWSDESWHYLKGYSVVFDTYTQELFEISSYVGNDTHVYRNPKYQEAYTQECIKRNITEDLSVNVTFPELYKLIYNKEYEESNETI